MVDAQTGISVSDPLDAIMKRHALIGKSLVVPVRPLPDEGPSEFLFRAAAENGYARVRDVTSLCGPSDGPLNPRTIHKWKPDIGRMCAVIASDSEHAEITSLFRPLGCGDPGYTDFFGVRLKATEMLTYRRVAPRQLQAASYLRAAWSLRFLSFDPTTGERLLDCCPLCKGRLGFVRSRAGIASCDKCLARGVHVDLRDFPQPFADVQDEEALTLITELISPSRQFRTAVCRRLHVDLRHYPVHELLETALALAKFAARAGRSDETAIGRHYVPSVTEIETSGRAILNWPNGVNQILEGLRCHESGERGFFHPASRRTYENLLGRSSLLSNSLRSGRLQLAACHTSKGACATTTRRPGPVARDLVVVQPMHRRDTSENELVAPSGDNVSPQRHLADVVGVPLAVVQDLLTGSAKDIFDRILQKPSGRAALLRKLEDILIASVVPVVPPQTLVAVAKLVPCMPGLIRPWRTVLEAILGGRIPCHVAQRVCGKLIYRLMVPAADALCLISRTSDAFDEPTDFDLGFDDAAVLLGVHPRHVRSLKRADLIKPRVTQYTLHEFKEIFMLRANLFTISDAVGQVRPGFGSTTPSLGMQPQIIGGIQVWSREGVISAIRQSVD